MSFALDAAIVEHDLAQTELAHQMHIMGRNYDGDADFLKALEEPHDFHARSGSRLPVGSSSNEQRRLAEIRTRELGASLRATRRYSGACVR